MPGVATIRSFLVGSWALLLALWAQRALERAAFGEAAILYGVAMLLLVGAIRHFPRLLTNSATVLAPPLPQPATWQFVAVLAALALSGLALRNLSEVERPTLAFWRLHLASVGLFLLGSALLDLDPAKAGGRVRAFFARSAAPTASAAASVAPPRSARRAIALFAGLLLITILALFLRLWRFDELPFGTWYDEAENGLQALRILENPGFYPIFVGSIHAPAHYVYLIAWAFQWLGVSTESIRAVSVVMGLVTVWAGYLVGRELFGRAGGLMLALLLAVSRWNVNFSRIGMYNASTPLFELLTIGFLLRALRRGRYGDFALAGFFLGLGLCFYAAFQLFVPVVGLFVLALTLTERGFWPKYWRGLVVLGCAAFLVIAPVVKYAYEQPEVYFERTADTSIFAKKASGERLAALLENTRKHLLMFNWRGDPNGRHNLPGEPMLDPYSAALLVLGLGLALWTLLRGPGRSRALLLLAWLGVTLLGGILSLDFEAPQSLRAIGSQPAAYVLALLPLMALWRAWRDEGGRYAPNFVLAPLALLFVATTYANFHTYFFRQAFDFASWNAFSTPETITANLLNEVDDQTDPYVISFFHGHPTLNFLARHARRPLRIETTDHLPLPWPGERNVALIVNAESRSLMDEVRRYYPNAPIQEFQPPFGGPVVVDYALLTPQDITSVQGLVGHYYEGDVWADPPLVTRQERTLSFDWANYPPLPSPFTAEWEGVLRIDNYGPHQFFLQAPAAAELYIGEEQIATTTGADAANGAVVLAVGNHAIRVRAVGGSGPFSLAWRPPDRGPELVPATALYVPPVTSNGLLGRYFPNAAWQAPEALAKIDPQLNLYFHIVPLPRPYTVEWTGKIAIPQAGSYQFGLEAIDEATLWIDEQQVTASTEPNVLAEGATDLTAGLHDIRIRYSDRTDHTHVNLYWTPPNLGRQIVPAAALFPPQRNYERVTMPNLAALVFDPQQPAAPQVVSQPLAGAVTVVQSGLNQPRGIATGPDGTVYVAETGNHRILVLSPAGEQTGVISEGSQPFVEPFDLAVDGLGNLYVLDAGPGVLAIFDAQGRFLRDLPTPSPILSRARGLFVTADGQIWVADTPGGRVVTLDQSGQVVQETPVWPGTPSQPVDVAVGVDGTIYVSDAGIHKLVRFADAGDGALRRQLAWEIPVANTLDGSHLAVDGQGQLYLSQPEQSQIALLSPAGEQIGLWSLEQAGAGRAKPVGVAVGPDGRVWTVDSVGGSVLVVEPEG